MKRNLLVLLTAAASVICIIIGTGIGTVYIDPYEIIGALAQRLYDKPLPEGMDESAVTIIADIRLPRVLLAFFAGAALSASGAAIQSVLNNPLASPYTLGVSSGASVGAGFVIVLGINLLGTFSLAAAGLMGAVLSMGLVIAFSSGIDRNLGSVSVVLTGMVLSLFLSAGVNLMAYFSGDRYKQIMKWQTGTFSGRGWNYTVVMAAVCIIGVILLMLHSRELDLLTFGNEQAISAGVDAGKVKTRLLLISAVLTGTAVAFSGVIGFIDMIVPQAVRKVFGAEHRYIIPMSAAAGGCFMVICDMIARTILAPNEISVGIITAVIGAPIFAYIFMKGYRK